MRTRPCDVRRYLRVLDLRGQGLSQSAVARATDHHVATVARIERRFRRGTLPVPADALVGAIKTEYDAARSQAVRAQLLSKLVDLVVEDLRARRAEAELKKWQTLAPLVPAAPSEVPPSRAPLPPPEPPPSSRFEGVTPEVWKRATEILSRVMAEDERTEAGGEKS